MQTTYSTKLICKTVDGKRFLMPVEIWVFSNLQPMVVAAMVVQACNDALEQRFDSKTAEMSACYTLPSNPCYKSLQSLASNPPSIAPQTVGEAIDCIRRRRAELLPA